MPQTRIPSYRLHKPTGKAVVTLNGRDFYLGQWNSPDSHAEYERLIGEWLANGRCLTTMKVGDQSIAELLLAYWEFAKVYYAKDGEPTKELACMRDAIRPLKELYSHTAVRDFGPLSLKAVRQRMIEKGHCRTHINHQVNRIRRVFRWGVENELVPTEVHQALKSLSPLKHGRTEARESEPVRPVSDEHVEAVLPHVARQVAAMIRLQQLTGMRPGEVVRIRPRDVNTTGETWIFTLAEHKTAYRGHQREVYLGPRAQEILRPWLSREPDSYCFSPAEAEAERNANRRKRPILKIPTKGKAKGKRAKRGRYDTCSYRRAIVYGIAKAKIPAWHPHQLRHTAATRVRHEFGLEAAQVILGHRSAQTTEIYAEASREKGLAVISRIG